jgi:RNA polymerase sigma-70 factor (ECF subfamily)
MADDDDGELMLRYARGDLRAFTALYARHRNALYRYLARFTRDREAANDLFQEVWSRVIAHRAQYEPRAKFRTFLFRIAHNCCIDNQRRQAARPQHRGVEPVSAGDDWESALPAPECDLPDTRAEQSELLLRYRAALDDLPSEQRDVFLLYEQSGLSLEEVAAITGVGLETAKSRLRYALAKLRQALVPAEDGRAERAVRGTSRGAVGAESPAPDDFAAGGTLAGEPSS